MALQLQLQPTLKNGVFQYPSATRPYGNRKKVSFQAQATPTRTQRIMEGIAISGEVGGAGGAYSYSALKRLDQLWSKICSASAVVEEPQKVVSSVPGSFKDSEHDGNSEGLFDVIVCGGTLGIFIATALSSKGLRVGVVERNVLKGREQEWNISRKELLELVEVGILTENDIEEATAASFNPNRCGFEGKGDVWVQGILNLGVSPVKLVDIVKERFYSLGGVTFEGYSVSNISVYQDAAVLQLKEGKTLFSRLIIDAMGNFSPIVKQIRCGRKPDGMCLVVGTCCRGFKESSTSDVIFSSASTKEVGQSLIQYFWEAFPAGSGPIDRTTYMFTYVDPQPGSPQLEELLEDYWDLMPKYQGVSLDDLEILRIIFGIFPTYRDSPLPAAFDRILQFGDASGIQSPVSFGGFGSLTRHLGRLTTGIYEALEGNFLDSKSLSMLNPYMPNLSSSWLFQRAMSAKKQSNVPPDFINELLFVNFISMQKLGDPVLRPFLQDVIQFGPLVKTLGLVMLTRPQIIPSIFKQVGIPVLVEWFGHFMMLGYYTFLSTFLDPTIRPLIESFPAKMRYEWKRGLEAWQYGAGLDYKLSPSEAHETTKRSDSAIIAILPSKTQALMPYTRPVFDLMFPQEDPFKILEQTPLTIPRGIDPSVALLARSDWKETSKEHIISLDIPGMKREDVKIEVEENRVLRISGERKTEEENIEGEKWHRVERTSGKFWRQFKLPRNADLDHIKANLENGVLKITVPKLAEEEKKQSKIISISEDGNAGGEDIKATKAAM